MNTLAQLMGVLEKLIEQGTITATKTVGQGTMVCFTQTTVTGTLYHQYELEAIPAQWGKAFLGCRVGTIVGEFRIVGIFDVWATEVNVGIQRTEEISH